MAIHYDAARRLFHLQTQDTSYALQIVHAGYPAHLYWGSRVRGLQLDKLLEYKGRASFSPTTINGINDFSLDTLPQEYPGYGTSDYRHPAYQVKLPDGSTVAELLYDSHRIVKGKPQLPGLPATYVETDDEAETLELKIGRASCRERV